MNIKLVFLDMKYLTKLTFFKCQNFVFLCIAYSDLFHKNVIRQFDIDNLPPVIDNSRTTSQQSSQTNNVHVQIYQHFAIDH